MKHRQTTTDIVTSHLDIVVADATAGAVTVTLPNPTFGTTVTVVKLDATVNAVNVKPAPGSGAQCLVNNLASFAIATRHESRQFSCDGNTWWTVT